METFTQRLMIEKNKLSKTFISRYFKAYCVCKD